MKKSMFFPVRMISNDKLCIMIVRLHIHNEICTDMYSLKFQIVDSPYIHSTSWINVFKDTLNSTSYSSIPLIINTEKRKLNLAIHKYFICKTNNWIISLNNVTDIIKICSNPTEKLRFFDL